MSATARDEGRVATCLWFDGRAEEAARHYVSLLPGSEMGEVFRFTSDWPGGKAGDVVMVEFALAGQRYQGLNGGPSEGLSAAVSISVMCEDQAEVDRLWAALTDGGREVACGWLEDRFGLSWQIVPRDLIEMLRSPERERAARAMAAMTSMVKLDVAALRRAFDGTAN